MRAKKSVENSVKMRGFRRFDGVFARTWCLFILDSCRLDLKASRGGLKYAVCAKTVQPGVLFLVIFGRFELFS